MVEPDWRGIVVSLKRRDYTNCRLLEKDKKTGGAGTPEEREEKNAQKPEETLGRNPEQADKEVQPRPLRSFL